MRRWLLALVLLALGVPAVAQTIPTPTYAAVILSPQSGTPAGVTNGQCWTQSTGLICRINGVTVGPFSASTGTVTSVTGSGGTTGLTLTGGPITSSGTLTLGGQLVNAALANSATTVNGQTCTLGSTCTVTASAGTVTVGTTTVAGGTTARVLYDNGGLLGEYTATQLTALVNAFSSTLSGAAPASGGGTANFLRADGTWAAPPGVGTVTSVDGSGGTTGLTLTGGPITTSGSLTLGGQLVNAALANPSTTVNGQTCTLGSTCTVTAASTGVTVGTTTIGSGTTTRVLYDNGGLLGEYTATQLTALVDAFSSTLSGAAPASGGGTANFLRADGTWTAPPGVGTVTSVALSIPGIFTISGSPVTGSGTLTATPSGTSGGVPYFSSSTALSSSGALSANLPVIGGGAGVAPSSGSRSGNTTVFGTTSGSLTSGNCVRFDASGNLVDAGAACGTGSGTVTTSGSPASGNLTKFSGAAAITNGDLSGDCSTSGTLAVTCSGLAKLNTAQAWTAAQRGTPATLAISTATFTPNFDTAQNFSITLVHASCPCTIANPSTTPVAGQSGMMAVAQSSTGSDTVSWGGQYKFAGATAPTLSTGANAVDFFPYYVFSATQIIVGAGVLNGS